MVFRGSFSYCKKTSFHRSFGHRAWATATAIFFCWSLFRYMLHLSFELWWFSYIQLFALMLQNHEVVAWRKQFFFFSHWIFDDSNHHLLSVLLRMKSFGARPSVGDDGWFVNYGPETMVCQLCFGNSTWFGDYGAWFGNCPEYVSETMVICFDVSRARNAGSGWDVKIQSREEASRQMGLKKTKYGEWDVKIQTCQEKGLPRARDVKGTPYEEKVETSEKDVKRKRCQRDVEASRQTGGPERVANRKGCQQMDGEGLPRGRCETVRTIFGSAPHLNLRFTSFQSRLGTMGRMALWRRSTLRWGLEPQDPAANSH